MALPQPLHIFRKDLMHLWPETLFCLLLFVGFAAAAPSAWAGSEYLPLISLGAFLIKILMVVSWLVLIARAIQDESLVGDRQFWTSRPYHWASLLAAKLLLIVTCIYLPFFLMQVYLLHHAGLYPSLVIPALLHNLLLLTVVIVIPLAALSAVTSTFPRVLLAFIGAVIAILILGGVIVYFKFLDMQAPHLDWILDAIFIGIPAVVLVYQYKTRKTMPSRVLLIATPLIAVILVLLVPSKALIESAYPVTKSVTFAGLSDTIHPTGVPEGELVKIRDFVSITLPVSVSGIDKEADYMVQGVRTTVKGVGVDYTSTYQNVGLVHNNQFTGERPIAPVSFFLPASIFEKIKSTPVDLHLQLAADQLKADKPSTWHATLQPFSVPGNGICSYPADPAKVEANPSCRYPLKQPDISFVTAQLAAGSCAQPAAPPVPGRASVGSSGTSLDFDPVITVPLKFETGDPDPQHNYLLCPGTPLTFIEAQKLPNASLVFDQKGVVLDAFAERFKRRQNVPGPAMGAHPGPQGDPEPGPEQPPNHP